MSSSPSRPDAATWSFLTAGVVVASTSAILIRYAQDSDPLAISFWRCAVGAVALLPFLGRPYNGIDRRGALLAAASGAFLAFHFATWITSVRMTSVAASVLLVSTTPVFTALVGRLAFAERLPRRSWVGIFLAVGGAAIVGGADFAGSSLGGNVLAVCGAAGAAGYFMLAERAQKTISIIQFAVVAYGVAAALLLMPVLVVNARLVGYDAATWWALGAIVVGPQLLGHTVINFVLRNIDSTTVAVVVMAEPIIAGGLALLLFGEHPSGWLYAGGAAILAGIYSVTSARRAARRSESVPAGVTG